MAKTRATDDTALFRSFPAGSPERRAAALRLVGSAMLPDVLAAAIEELADEPDGEVRAALLARYEACISDPARRDSGCYVRAALLQALRPITMPVDRPLLERAIATYEYLPPGRSEVAAGLRAAAVIALNEIDPVLAAHHSARLLWDARTSQMSGEPAVTAASLLGSQEQTIPLYAYVSQTDPPNAEVIGACLRNLIALPRSLLPGVLSTFREHDDEIVVLGLSDLALAHPARDLCTPVVLELLNRRLPNLFRYLVLAIRASRQDALIGELKRLAREERDPFRAEILREALEPTR
ncbi:MAG TPA: hypothetical protein VN837_17400 [Chloroflexota bacterium]|nr:hypothetical protein [Chloroflexota bacterium]